MVFPLEWKLGNVLPFGCTCVARQQIRNEAKASRKPLGTVQMDVPLAKGHPHCSDLGPPGPGTKGAAGGSSCLLLPIPDSLAPDWKVLLAPYKLCQMGEWSFPQTKKCARPPRPGRKAPLKAPVLGGFFLPHGRQRPLETGGSDTRGCFWVGVYPGLRAKANGI